MITGRPIRFLALTVGGWIAFRTVMLWPMEQVLPGLVRVFAPVAAAEPSSRAMARAPVVAERPRRLAKVAMSSPRGGVRKERAVLEIAAPRSAPSSGPPQASIIPAAVGGSGEMGIAPAGLEPPPAFVSSRLSASAWAIARAGGRSTPFASQLGGSQAGIRLAYAIDRARRVAVTARLSAALGSRQREGSVGIDWRPTRLPVHLVAEERIALDGARSGPSVGVIGGVGPSAIGAGFRLEAYGQAGVIARTGGQGFADGSVRISRPVATAGRLALDLGGGARGGAQRGASRLDIGPSVSAAIPVGRRSFRMSLDWRQRVAGQSRPGSGPALSLGTDF